MVWYEIVENFKKTITFIYDVIKYYNCLFVWMGTQAAKGEGLKILWHRPPRVGVRIPPKAFKLFFKDFNIFLKLFIS